jgi:uncharacterized protein (TIGR03435 family)
LLLKAKYPAAMELKRNTSGDRGNGFFPTSTGFRGWNELMDSFALSLEFFTNFPILDETGLTGRFDFDLNFTQDDLENQNWDSINPALGKLGLELVPTNMPLEMLVVEKAD